MAAWSWPRRTNVSCTVSCTQLPRHELQGTPHKLVNGPTGNPTIELAEGQRHDLVLDMWGRRHLPVAIQIDIRPWSTVGSFGRMPGVRLLCGCDEWRHCMARKEVFRKCLSTWSSSLKVARTFYFERKLPIFFSGYDRERRLRAHRSKWNWKSAARSIDRDQAFMFRHLHCPLLHVYVLISTHNEYHGG